MVNSCLKKSYRFCPFLKRLILSFSLPLFSFFSGTYTDFADNIFCGDWKYFWKYLKQKDYNYFLNETLEITIN